MFRGRKSRLACPAPARHPAGVPASSLSQSQGTSKLQSICHLLPCNSITSHTQHVTPDLHTGEGRWHQKACEPEPPFTHVLAARQDLHFLSPRCTQQNCQLPGPTHHAKGWACMSASGAGAFFCRPPWPSKVSATISPWLYMKGRAEQSHLLIWVLSGYFLSSQAPFLLWIRMQGIRQPSSVLKYWSMARAACSQGRRMMPVIHNKSTGKIRLSRVPN